MPGPGPNPSHGLEEKWRFQRSSGTTPPAIFDGVAFTGSNDGNLYALDVQTGTELWHFSGSSSLSSPFISEDMIFTGSENGDVYAVGLVDQTIRWQNSFNSALSLPVVEKEATVFSLTDSITCLDTQTGAERWRYSPPGAESVSSPTLGHGMVLTILDETTLSAIDGAVGSERWRADFPADVSSPTIANDKAIVQSGDGFLYAYDLSTGLETWRFSVEGETGSSPAISDGIVYAVNAAGTLFAVDIEQGAELWRLSNVGRSGPPVIADGMIFNTSRYTDVEAASITGIDTESRSIAWRHGVDVQPGVYWPVVTDGLILCCDFEGSLYAYGPAGAKLGPGMRARVVSSAILRGAPGTTAVERAALEPDTIVVLTDEPVTVGAARWWPVTVEDVGIDGWIEEALLTPI